MERPLCNKSEELLTYMNGRGYPESFSYLIASELNTEFTAGRMLGYLRNNEKLSLEDVTDEMLAILSDRDRIMQKYIVEDAQAKLNEYYNSRPGNDDCE